MESKKLEVGEKYLSISLFGKISIAAFKKKDRKGNEPHYVGNGVAVWVNEKKAKPK
jgi:hypothetical protein